MQIHNHQQLLRLNIFIMLLSFICCYNVIQEKCRDTLAEAMAHVHNEYLEEEIEEDVQMEVVDESVTTDVQVMSILPEAVDNVKEKPKETCEGEKIRLENKIDKKSGKVFVSDQLCLQGIGKRVDSIIKRECSVSRRIVRVIWSLRRYRYWGRLIK